MSNKKMVDPSEIADSISKYRDILIFAPLVLYITGFFIVNLHLGSLGIVNFDILRARYVVVGALFYVFIISLFVMLRGLVPKVISGKSFSRRFLDSLGYSLTVYGTPLLLVIFLQSLSGSRSAPAVWLSEISPQESPLSWAIGEPSEWLRKSLYLVIFIFAVYLIGFIFLLLFPPKESGGSRTPRKKVLIGGAKGLLIAIGIVALFLISFSIAQYLGMLTSARSVGLPRESLENWTPFISLHLVIYLFCAIFFFIAVSIRMEELKSGPSESENKDDLKGIYVPGFPLPLEGLALLFVILVPIYTLAAYPGIPQQVGGGSVIPVRISPAQIKDGYNINNCEYPTYLVDRTPNTTIVVYLNRAATRLDTFEISNSEIGMIEYYSECR